MKRIYTFLIILLSYSHSISSATPSCDEDPSVPSVVSKIIAEATRHSNYDPTGKPLPLAAHWQAGQYDHYWGDNPGQYIDPDYQVELIANGNYLIPTFAMPDKDPNWPNIVETYARSAMETLCSWRMPVTIMSSQWEEVLSKDEYYLTLPPEYNPNVVTPNGDILAKVSPFGPSTKWFLAGKSWTEGAEIKAYQDWYPDPPRVFFLSNNEHNKLHYSDAESESQRYISLHGIGKSDDEKRKIFIEAWNEKYRVLQAGMEHNWEQAAWRDNGLYVGYGVVAPTEYGRWGNWKFYSFYHPNNLNPEIHGWDGGSPPYYDHDWESSSQTHVFSKQVEFQSIALTLKETYKSNPDFWYEMSVWDGFEETEDPSQNKRLFYTSQGQEYTADRYKGWVQFGMWLTRPRVVREFRAWPHSQEDVGYEYFEAILEAVSDVHENELLKRFWRKGELVENHSRVHPFDSDIPPEYADEKRWYLLNTNLDPGPTSGDWGAYWNNPVELPVFSLALELGEAPNREWLVYAHSPLTDRDQVEITVPGFGNTFMNVSVSGGFLHLIEN